MEKHYNYLNDAMNIQFENAENYRIFSDKQLNCPIKTTICGKCYQDPDACSKKLYDDVSRCFKLNEIRLKTNDKKPFSLSFDDEHMHQLSIDYIGPSRAWAMKFLNGDNQKKASAIGDFLLVTRTIGGHVFWPAHQVNRKNTINQVRGGSGIYDRFDITLAELKNYFRTQIECDEKEDNPLFYKPLYDAFKRYEWFFQLYKNFDIYVETMKLDVFLHEGDVFSLAESDVEKGDYKPVDANHYILENYEQYIKNCKSVILQRTEMLYALI